eukprot:1173238-Amphidinium_carterae.2
MVIGTTHARFWIIHPSDIKTLGCDGSDPKSTRVVVAQCTGVPKGFQQWVGLQDLRIFPFLHQCSLLNAAFTSGRTL